MVGDSTSNTDDCLETGMSGVVEEDSATLQIGGLNEPHSTDNRGRHLLGPTTIEWSG